MRSDEIELTKYVWLDEYTHESLNLENIEDLQ